MTEMTDATEMHTRQTSFRKTLNVRHTRPKPQPWKRLTNPPEGEQARDRENNTTADLGWVFKLDIRSKEERILSR